MSQIQFDTANVSPGCTSAASPRGSGGGNGSFGAYLQKAQSASTAPADGSGGDGEASDSQTASNAAAAAAPSGSAPDASSAAPRPQPKAKARGKQEATPRNALAPLAQSETGSGQPAVAPPQPAVAVVGAAPDVPSATSASPLPATAATQPAAPAAAMAATANSNAEPTAGPDIHPGLAAKVQAGLPPPAPVTTAVAAAAPAMQGSDTSPQVAVSPQPGQQATDLPSGATATTANAGAEPTTSPDIHPGLAADAQATQFPVRESQKTANAGLADTPAAVPTEPTAQANATVSGVASTDSADGGEHKKEFADRGGDSLAASVGPLMNADAAAIAAASNPTAAPASASPAAPSKDKSSAADTTISPVANAASNALPVGTAASPQNSSPTTAAAASPQSGSVGQTDQARFLQRVTAAFQSVGDRSGSVRIMLSPPELGSLRLEVSVQNGAMSAHLQAENPAARNLLLDNLPALRDRLAGQNIKIDRFDVDVMDRQLGGGAAGQTFSQSHANFQGANSGSSFGRAARDSQPGVAADAASARENPVVETTRLNVVV